MSIASRTRGSLSAGLRLLKNSELRVDAMSAFCHPGMVAANCPARPATRLAATGRSQITLPASNAPMRAVVSEMMKTSMASR